MDKKIKNAFIEWLYDEKAILKENNVYFAERAFLANAAIKWCAIKKKKKELTRSQIEKYVTTIKLFLQKKLDLHWKDGNVDIQMPQKKQRHTRNINQK